MRYASSSTSISEPSRDIKGTDSTSEGNRDDDRAERYTDLRKTSGVAGDVGEPTEAERWTREVSPLPGMSKEGIRSGRLRNGSKSKSCWESTSSPFTLWLGSKQEGDGLTDWSILHDCVGKTDESLISSGELKDENMRTTLQERVPNQIRNDKKSWKYGRQKYLKRDRERSGIRKIRYCS